MPVARVERCRSNRRIEAHRRLALRGISLGRDVPDNEVPVLGRREHVSRVPRPAAETPCQLARPGTKTRGSLDGGHALDVALEPADRRLGVEVPDARGAVCAPCGDEPARRVEARERGLRVQRGLHLRGIRDREGVFERLVRQNAHSAWGTAYLRACRSCCASRVAGATKQAATDLRAPGGEKCGRRRGRARGPRF